MTRPCVRMGPRRANRRKKEALSADRSPRRARLGMKLFGLAVTTVLLIFGTRSCLVGTSRHRKDSAARLWARWRGW